MSFWFTMTESDTNRLQSLRPLISQFIHRVNVEARVIPPTVVGCHLLSLDWQNDQLYIQLVRERPFKKFNLPGGKLEAGETCDAALTRELLEEVGYDYNPECFEKAPRISSYSGNVECRMVVIQSLLLPGCEWFSLAEVVESTDVESWVYRALMDVFNVYLYDRDSHETYDSELMDDFREAAGQMWYRRYLKDVEKQTGVDTQIEWVNSTMRSDWGITEMTNIPWATYEKELYGGDVEYDGHAVSSAFHSWVTSPFVAQYRNTADFHSWWDSAKDALDEVSSFKRAKRSPDGETPD